MTDPQNRRAGYTPHPSESKASYIAVTTINGARKYFHSPEMRGKMLLPLHLHCPKGDPERRRRRDRTPTPSLPSKFSPPQTQTLSEAQKAKRTNVPGSRKRGGKWSAFPPKANAEGIRVARNQSCRASSRGLGVGPRMLAGSRGWKEAPGASRGRWPCREQVVRRLRSRPHSSNFPTAWRVNGSEKAREAGKEGAVRGSWYRVHVRSGAAPWALLSAGSAPEGRLLEC